MAQTFLFYDLETSGIHKCFDQILQFAAIRTDLALNELERYEIMVRLNPDTLPDPGATITHHIGIEQANRRGISEYQAVQKIHKLLNQPETISVGYNTLGFDDEFLRFAFHRNLLPPYTHQFANGCRRMDIYPLVPVYYLYENAVLNWPEREGRISFRLEDLNAANNLVSGGRAHDAMVDIEVTIELAKRLQLRPKMWQYLLGSFERQVEQERFVSWSGGLQTEGEFYRQCLAVNGIFGTRCNFQAPLLHLGRHYHYQNQECFIRLDIEDLKVPETAAERLPGVVRKKWGEPPILLPAYGRFTRFMTQEALETVKANKAWLEANPQLLAAIREAVLNYTYPEVEGVDADATLYTGGFPSSYEQQLADHFHQQPFARKGSMLDQLPQHMRTRAIRIIGREDAAWLPETAQYEFVSYMERIASFDKEDLPVDYKGEQRRSVVEVYEAIQGLRETGLSDEQMALLDELEDYLS